MKLSENNGGSFSATWLYFLDLRITRLILIPVLFSSSSSGFLQILGVVFFGVSVTFFLRVVGYSPILAFLILWSPFIVPIFHIAWNSTRLRMPIAGLRSSKEIGQQETKGRAQFKLSWEVRINNQFRLIPGSILPQVPIYSSQPLI